MAFICMALLRDCFLWGINPFKELPCRDKNVPQTGDFWASIACSAFWQSGNAMCFTIINILREVREEFWASHVLKCSVRHNFMACREAAEPAWVERWADGWTCCSKGTKEREMIARHFEFASGLCTCVCLHPLDKWHKKATTLTKCLPK